MRSFLNWLLSKPIATVPTENRPSFEWGMLEKAMLARDFNAVTLYLRPWSLLPERDLKRLKETAKRASFSATELNKLEILFQFYVKDLVVAFAQAQEHMKEHGFDPDLHVVSLFCLYQNRQFEDAQTYLQQLEAEKVDSMHRADYWQLVSAIRWANNDMCHLQQSAERALELAPDDGAILQTSLGMYIELGLMDKIRHVRTKLTQMPDAQGYAHSLALLSLGEYEQGWKQMENRYDAEESPQYINEGLKPYPRWQGESLAGVRLLLSAEQGLGDTIQMARYFPLLQTLQAQQIVVETQAETLTLLQYNFPEIPMVERRWAQAPAQEFDCWTGMMSLPYHLKAWGSATPGRSGYLRVPPENTDYWHPRTEQLGTGHPLKIGLAWSGQPRHQADRRRSIPFELMMKHVQDKDIVFFALQTQVPQNLPSNVINVSEEMITLADTAALIAQMDLVITVDTSVVHIAGALGKETWLLLPKRYEWRWGLDGETNDWYDSVKVIRQTEHANWQQVLTDVFEHRLPARFNR